MAIQGDQIVSRCDELGFALAGVCKAEPSDHADEMRDWLARGEHGSMGYLANNVELRLDPRVMALEVRSIIMVADQYAARPTGESTATDQERDDPPLIGRIARYAQGRDYHVVIKKRLHALCDELREVYPEAMFRVFVDTAPVLEREHAARAGLGWIGKHTLLIHPKLGSWTLLGGVLTSLDITPPENQRPVADHCGACTRCIDACPTGAISPFAVNASRCVSYLTIENREPIDPQLQGAIGDWIFGCDICQEVCPHNSPRETGFDAGEPNKTYESARTGFDLLSVLNWTEDDRRRQFQTSALKRATLAMMQRNAIIALAGAAAGQPSQMLRNRLNELSNGKSVPELVRQAARNALAGR